MVEFIDLDFNVRNLKNKYLALTIISAVIILTFLLPSTSASFSVGKPNYSIEKIYGPSANITGWVNMSLSSEPLNSVFEDSRGNSANLSQVLKNNIAYSYSCSPVDCKDDYSGSAPGLTKTATINSDNTKIYGIKLTGKIFKIDSFRFTLESNAGPECTNQIEVDFLDDGILDSRNKNSLDSQSCTSLKNYGCFNSGETQEEQVIGPTTYCEKVILSSSPGFFIGAWVKKVSGSKTVNASIYKTSGGAAVATCTLPDASSSGGEVSCNVSYSVINPGEHYVCINSVSGSGNYRTRGYSTTNGCGFYGTPVPSVKPAAYQIFSQGKQFDSVGILEINSSVSSGETFAKLAEDYIIKKYGTQKDCSSGCVIPIKITSNANQDIILRDLQVDYQKESGVVVENNFYDVQATPAKASSSFQKLYLDGSGFSVPSSLGNQTFSLDFNGQRIVSEKIEIKDVPIIKSVGPLKTAAAFPTEFAAVVDSKYNLTGFSWDFGDGTLKVNTLTGKASHTYNSIGVYNLKVTATDQRQLAGSSVFFINVTSPKDLINLTLVDMEENLENIKTEVSSFPQFYRDALNASLNFDYLEEKIDSLKAAYQGATTETQYNAIVTELVGLNIPEGISKSRSAPDITLFSGPSYVNMNVLQEIAGGNYSSDQEEGYINGVLLWQRENLDVSLNFNEFSGRYSGRIEPITRTFEITIDEKRDIAHDYYLIMPELSGFKSSVPFSTKSGYVYVDLKGKNSVSFSTTEDVDFTNLPAFISPAISRLTVTEEAPPEEKPKWTIFILVIVFLLVLGFIGYIVLQEWYRRRYEHYLFPNRNDLYNMVNYVNNAKRKGLKNSDIENNLKKTGWSAERIRYVMRKYAGKRTGMLEIPITKLAEKAGGKPKNPK